MQEVENVKTMKQSSISKFLTVSNMFDMVATSQISTQCP